MTPRNHLSSAQAINSALVLHCQKQESLQNVVILSAKDCQSIVNLYDIIPSESTNTPATTSSPVSVPITSVPPNPYMSPHHMLASWSREGCPCSSSPLLLQN